jgi:hypothetical protein
MRRLHYLDVAPAIDKLLDSCRYSLAGEVVLKDMSGSHITAPVEQDPKGAPDPNV